MCSIGHHDGPDMPAKAVRRHLDKSASSNLRKVPRGELAKRRADVLASLRFTKESGEADALAAQHGVGEQLELVPPDMAQLPRSSFRTRQLPEPQDLYYSAAREA